MENVATNHEALALALSLHQARRLTEAEQIYQQILQAEPNHAEALHLLGVIAHDRGKPELAVDYIQRALALDPNKAVYYGNLGLACQSIGRIDVATECLRRALMLAPDFVEAHNNLGNVYAEQKQFEEAIQCYKKALQINPVYADVYNNLGNAHADLGRLEEALPYYQRALQLKPNYPEACNNYGNALRDLGRLQESEHFCREATRLNPNYFEAYNNLGAALHEQGRLHEALACYAESIRLNPDYPEAHWNQALGWLALGNFEQGWPEYEWRFKRKIFPPRPFTQPMWDGSPLNGQTILIHAEQGFGDTLQFIRYATLVKQRGGRVVVACPAMLAPLVATCPGVDQVVPDKTPLPPFDVHLPMLSAPYVFRTTLATIPADVPYLFADPEREQWWRDALADADGFKIGLSWKGDAKHRKDRFRSIPLAKFEPLARLDGVRLFSLQVGPGVDQIAELAGRFPITDLDSYLQTFADTAAVMKNLDLVITIDSAVAHGAGALGVPVWVAIPAAPDFRWMLQREDSPWYPTMRLFRQKQLGEWDEVIDRLVAAVSKLACQSK